MAINAAKAKNINRSRILNIIRKKNNLSRQEIANAIGLSAPAVGNIVSELISEGLVRETGRRQNQRGQPSKELELCADGAYALGLFLESNEVSGAMVNLAGEVQAQKQISLLKKPSPKEALNLLVDLTDKLLTKQQRTKFWGIGLATFGPLDLEAGMINAPQRSKEWVGLPLRDQLAEATQLTVYLDNDATAAAIGEHWYGAGQNYRNYLFIHLTDGGVGGGLFLDGSVYRGGSLNAAEFGHMIVKHEEELKYLEDIVSLKVFAQHLDTKDTLAVLETSFKANDELLLSRLDEAADVLAQSIVSADHLLDLDAVILGGQNSKAFLQCLLDKTRAYCLPLFMPGKPRQTELILGQTGQNSAVLGAATLPLYDAFTLPAHITSTENVFSSALEGVS